jgi:hypothetical protein
MRVALADVVAIQWIVCELFCYSGLIFLYFFFWGVFVAVGWGLASLGSEREVMPTECAE